jgi:adenine-specific DNA-methyltransferase
MQIVILSPRKSLNKAYLKVKPSRSEIELFKTNLIGLLDGLDETESEEHNKNDLVTFLKNTFYQKFYINTKGRNDLVIHNGPDAKSFAGVLIEAKKPSNKSEMIRPDNLNAKAFHELILYYLRERITNHNLQIKHLVATNIYEWYVFDASIFEKVFAQNKTLVKQFTDFEEGRLSGNTTDFFYKQIAEPFLVGLTSEICFTFFDFQEYDKPLRNEDKKDDSKLIALYKLLSPEHLLKLPFTNDSNSLDKAFYAELLHIIGLTESKEGSKKLIGRKKEGARDLGSLIENAIVQIDSRDMISRITKPARFGETTQGRLFNVSLELAITWINRILFLKLLEAQLINYHKGDPAYAFLNSDKLKGFDALDSLFFRVLAKKATERDPAVAKLFDKVPYLNSSLFEPTELERDTIFISNLQDDCLIPIHPGTVLKSNTGKRLSGNMNGLDYLFAFLNAYDFSGEGAEEIQEENKTLINASVLGLIFEKINGYKDGSFFTPGFITMYMCRETIRRAVFQKFNDLKGWDCKDMEGLYNKIEDKKEANEIINQLKICDPAVGSGHFLVSALNEIVAIKSELKILSDKTGKRLKEYHIEVVNDELIITDEDGDLFEYNPSNLESQRIQETLFIEKQTIIENCLFGVDINPNSVKICRLRLWIELLKSSYYKAESNFTELETLPNIDINIKCGNSLISRYALDADIKQALKKSKWSIESYRMAVSMYRNATSKEQKREMERLIASIKTDFETEVAANDKRLLQLKKINGDLFNLTQQTSLFERTKKELADWNKQVNDLTGKIKKLETALDEIKNNKIYENAFEWRLEFPEVLNDEGDFVGFDVVIGNPPYIRQEQFATIKPYLQQSYTIYNPIADLLTYFIELSYNILKTNGTFQFIISNKFTHANYGKQMRSYLLQNTRITHFVDFSGLPVFDEATVDAAILGFIKKTKSETSFLYANIQKDKFSVNDFDSYLSSITKSILQNDLSSNTWTFENPQVLDIKRKIEAFGIPLKDWDVTINYGLKTGLNEAFVIDGNKREELILQDPRSADILKPLLRGRDLKKYSPEYQDLWLIYIPWHFPLHDNKQIDCKSNEPEIEFEKRYPAIFRHLLQFKVPLLKRNQAEIGIRYEWFALQRFGSSYYQDFEKPKIIYPNMTKFLPFVLDFNDHYYHNDKSFHLISNCIYWLGAFLNSKLFDYCFRGNFPELLGGTRELRKIFFEQIHVKPITEVQEQPFKKIITQILSIKKANSNADTISLEKEIDQLVYELYGLTEEEIAIVERT